MRAPRAKRGPLKIKSPVANMGMATIIMTPIEAAVVINIGTARNARPKKAMLAVMCRIVLMRDTSANNARAETPITVGVDTFFGT
mmetsp:Transcript_40489/g.41310  ORF Transcript_40489/g.41310 Transcript_40489/m.41310 type:complete len:85 (+) Transcript_40489:547-801(+)